MADGVELIPISDRDEAIFRAWEEGKDPHALSREFALPIRRVEEIIDRMLPVFDAQSQLRAYKRELRRLEDLSGEFFAIAKRVSPVNVRMDPLTVEVQQQPSRHERIREVIMNLRIGGDGQQPNDGNGQSGSSPDPEPSR